MDPKAQALLDKARKMVAGAEEDRRRIESIRYVPPKPGGRLPQREGQSAAKDFIAGIHEQLREPRARIKEIIDEQEKDFKDLLHDTARVMDVLPEQARRDLRATDGFGREVQREDKLLEQQEARWSQEDRKAGRK